MSTEITLPVTGMTCGGCENAVKRALGLLPGVADVDASHRAATVRVTFDPAQTSRADIERRIGQLGYTVGAA
jgi:copper chaperone CopZ